MEQTLHSELFNGSVAKGGKIILRSVEHPVWVITIVLKGLRLQTAIPLNLSIMFMHQRVFHVSTLLCSEALRPLSAEQNVLGN